jgi:hypothetical protein
MHIRSSTSTFRVFTLALLVCLAPLAPVAQAAEILRTFWHGQWVDYVEQGDSAVTEGDIIIGQKDAVREWSRVLALGAQQTTAQRKALTIDAASRLWQRAPSGVIEVPFTIEAGNTTNINAAVAEANRALAGTLQWVPRVAQTDYVAFNATVVNNGGCSSAVGRSGGRQQIQGDPECGVSTFVHEMGHAMGLWHVQQDADANAFVDIKLPRMDPSKRSNNSPIFATRTLDGYDYASIMHYSRTGFTGVADRLTLETRPLGIDIGAASTYSRSDLDGLLRLYGVPSQRTTVNSNPEGLRVVVDGVTVTTPAEFDWPVGSVHRVWASTDLQSKGGYQFAFARWSHDAGAAPSTQLTWQVTAGDGLLGTPTSVPSSTILTANFSRLIDVAFSPATQTGGTVTVAARAAPWPNSTTLFPQFTLFDIQPVASAGFLSFGLFGSATAFNGAIGLRPNFSLLVGAGVAAQTIGVGFHNGATIAVDVVGDGILDAVNLSITAPGATTATTSTAPRISRTTPGTWKYSMPSPQFIGTSIRHIFDGLDGFDSVSSGSTATTGEVAMPASGVRSVSVRAHRELLPYKQVIPACAGSIALTDASTWVRYGSTLGAVVIPSTSAIFTGWSGTASGTATSVSTLVGAAIPEFVATFNTVAEPLRLTRLSQRTVGDDTVSAVITISGTGFASTSMVNVAGVVMTPTFVDSQTLRVNLSRALFATAGRGIVSVSNTLSGSCSVFSNSLAIDVLPAGRSVGLALIEYYSAALDYYFLTGRAGDIAALDARPDLFLRTGQKIKLYGVPNVDTLPLERHIFDKVARGGTRASHFFTASPADQVLLTSINPSNANLAAKPVLEGVEGYAIPNRSDGTCPVGTTPIYRAFKGAPRYVDDGNHRFSASVTQHQDMVNRLGWSDEGVVFCGVQ